MSASLFWVGLFAQIVLMISAASLPSCQLSDSECLKLTAQSAMPMLIAGIPDISAENLDPLHLDKVKVELAGLKLSVKGADIKGLSKSTIDKVKVNLKKKILQVVYHCDVQMMGKYKASGKLLILPISGDGDMLLKLKNMEVKLSMPFEFNKNSDGNDVMDLKSFSLIYDVKDGAQFGLTNLFDGNKELSDSMLKFMNENWKVLTEEFGLPILEAGHKVVFDSIKKFLATQPIQNTA